MVPEIIEQKKSEIAALCRTYRIRALWLFGSAVTGAWNPATSDFDFLVDLGEYSGDYATRFFALRRDLERMMKREVDVVSLDERGNGWLREEIDATKVNIYDARYDQLVA